MHKIVETKLVPKGFASGIHASFDMLGCAAIVVFRDGAELRVELQTLKGSVSIQLREEQLLALHETLSKALVATADQTQQALTQRFGKCGTCGAEVNAMGRDASGHLHPGQGCEFNRPPPVSIDLKCPKRKAGHPHDFVELRYSDAPSEWVCRFCRLEKTSQPETAKGTP